MAGESEPNDRSGATPYPLDRELVARLLGGSDEAWCELVSRYTNLVRSRIESVTATCGIRNDGHALDDLIAEVFAALLCNDGATLRAYQGRSSLATYLGVIASRIAMRYGLERKKSIPSETLDLQVDHRFDDPQVAALKREQALAVQSYIHDLPEKQRRIVQLYFEEGCTFHEISQKLSIPIGSIGPTLMRAEESLRRKIETKSVSNSTSTRF